MVPLEGGSDDKSDGSVAVYKSETGCDRLVGDSPLSGGDCSRASEPKVRTCRRAEAQEARNQPLVDFLHSCRIFRCSWGVSLARFGSEGEEFFETTRRGRVDESQGKLFPSSVPFRREVIPTHGKDTVSRRKPAT